MLETPLSGFDRYPNEGAIVGRLLAAYGVLGVDVELKTGSPTSSMTPYSAVQAGTLVGTI
jgi:hypothetical protein